jgi:tRNA 2-thiouridine synthesizing protein E
MEPILFNGLTITTDDAGYLKDYKQWSPDLAVKIAASLNIDLTEKHFQLIHWLREKYAEGVPLTIRKVANSGIVDIKQFYQLFPGGPLKNAARIAGIPKPVSCI